MAETVSERLFDAFNRKDVEAVVELADDDFELVDVATGEVFHGKEGARRNAEGWFTAFPEIDIELVTVVADGEWEAVEAIGRGTNSGPIATPEGEIPATGRTIEGRFCSVARVRDGKIVEARDYYDLATLMRQLGLMPETAFSEA